MRLGQLARKYDISIQKIISYLDEIDQSYDSHHPNSKLDKETEALVEKHFEHLLVVSDPVVENYKQEPELIVQEEVVEEELQVVVAESDVVDTIIEETANVTEGQTSLPKEEEKHFVKAMVSVDEEVEDVEDQQEKDESIETDRLLELIESEETSVDLSKIRLIKAPKKELSGLKVVGKIDLPELKSKDVEPSEEEVTTAKSEKIAREKRRKISQEEREKRRLNAKRKKEEYEQRQERRKKEKEKKDRKARKEAHYKQQLQKANSNKSANKSKSKNRKAATLEDQLPEPTTIFGKLLRWLNT